MSTKLPHGLCSRRHFIEAGGFGLGMLGLATLLRQDGLLAAPIKPLLGNEVFDLLPKQPPRPAKAKAMISLFMMGGPSQMDLFDHKPMLTKWHGQKFPGDNLKYDNVAQASAKVLGSFWKFSRHGKCGMELSELLPQLGTVADDICLIRSMKSGVNNHLQAMLAM